MSPARATFLWVAGAIAALGGMAGAFFWMWTAGFAERPPCERLRKYSCPEILSVDEATECARIKGRWAGEDEKYCGAGLEEIAALREKAWARSSENSRIVADREEQARRTQNQADDAKAARCMPVLEQCLGLCSRKQATPPADMAELAARVDTFVASGAVECTKKCSALLGCP